MKEPQVIEEQSLKPKQHFHHDGTMHENHAEPAKAPKKTKLHTHGDGKPHHH